MLADLLIVLLRLYQRVISPLFGRVCRFEPSCSEYAIRCLAGHGALRGSYLTFRRLLRCHPFHAGGFDPPPPPRHGGPCCSQEEQTPAPQHPDVRPPWDSRNMASRCNLDVGV